MTENSEDEPLLGTNSNPGGIDLENRDPKLINEDVAKVDFADVIAEPGGIHSVDRVWIISNCTYTKSKWFLYRTLTALFGIPLSLIWGLVFAFLSFCNIWVVVPCIKCIKVEFECLIRPFIKCIKSCFRPCCKAVRIALITMRGIFRKEAV
ncbi:caveolin-3-like [Nelusetta ayraudi]|uniref:caveolin-3-like n=1 Tax=Nelusetta ayraudi TaxID=303726 RepID=UPI003F7079B5